MICKFLAFYKKTFYSESMIVLYDPVSMQFLFLFDFLSILSWSSISVYLFILYISKKNLSKKNQF